MDDIEYFRIIITLFLSARADWKLIKNSDSVKLIKESMHERKIEEFVLDIKITPEKWAKSCLLFSWKYTDVTYDIAWLRGIQNSLALSS